MATIDEVLQPPYADAWEVAKDGKITYKGHTGTVIEANVLTTGNRLTEVMSKVLDIDKANEQFYFAFLQALKNAGYSKLTIDLNDIHKSVEVG